MDKGTPLAASNPLGVPKEAQWREALTKANTTATDRSHAKQAIRAGTLSIGDALSLPCVASMRVEKLLLAQYKWGVYRASRVLNTAGVSAFARVKDCTERQLAALRQALDG